MYKYSYPEIARMTPYQKAALISPGKVSDVLYFETLEEYMEWQKGRSSS